jgi:excisionase family DNA binding protein
LADPSPLRSAEWAAKRLGISTWCVYELAKRGEIPCVRLGRRIRFDEAATEAFIAAGGTRFDDKAHPAPVAVLRRPTR